MLKHHNHSKSADLFLLANLQRGRGEGEGVSLAKSQLDNCFSSHTIDNYSTYKLHRGQNAGGGLPLRNEDVQYRANCNVTNAMHMNFKAKIYLFIRCHLSNAKLFDLHIYIFQTALVL